MIKTLRKQRKLTQEDLAYLIGNIDKSTISDYENGINMVPIDRLTKISLYLEVDSSVFLIPVNLFSSRVDFTDNSPGLDNVNIIKEECKRYLQLDIDSKLRSTCRNVMLCCDKVLSENSI